MPGVELLLLMILVVDGSPRPLRTKLAIDVGNNHIGGILCVDTYVDLRGVRKNSVSPRQAKLTLEIKNKNPFSRLVSVLRDDARLT